MKQTLRSPVLGTWLSSASPVVAELLAGAGFDFVTIDAEHGPVDHGSVLPLLQAIHSGAPSCQAYVRTPNDDPLVLRRFLDAGADGVIVPMVASGEQTGRILSVCRYPASGGCRGVGFCRDNSYGRSLLARVARDTARTVFVGIQIEHRDALDHLDAILSHDGIGVVFIGPYDLSASLGCAGDFTAPSFRNAVEQIREACLRHGRPRGIHIIPPDPIAVGTAITEGYDFIACSLDITMLTTAAAQLLSVRPTTVRRD